MRKDENCPHLFLERDSKADKLRNNPRICFRDLEIALREIKSRKGFKAAPRVTS